MRRAGLVAASIFVAVAAASCRRGPARCAAGTRSTLEVRDGNGALELAYKGHDVCDGQLRPIGDIAVAADGALTLHDSAGGLRLALSRESDQVAQGRGPGGPRLRLYRDGKELRVLTPDGVPLGAIVADAGLATLYNPAQAPLGRVQPRDRDAVVTDLSGTTLTYVVPASDPVAAGVFGVARLDRPEQLLIYLYWSR
jgi:hypothetical protein